MEREFGCAHFYLYRQSCGKPLVVRTVQILEDSGEGERFSEGKPNGVPG
jgi:hypothetical protein